MIGFELDDTVVVEQRQVLEQALSTNPKTQKALQKLIRQVILEARSHVASAAKNAMENDPRQAYRAVRSSVYKKILGANINIYNSRKAHGTNAYRPPRKLQPGQRGGNRRIRTSLDRGKYAPNDRGFILRWMNDGVGERNITNFKTDDRRTKWPSVSKWSKHPNTGNRGSVAAKNWFHGAAERQLVQAADNLANLIDSELMNILNKKKR